MKKNTINTSIDKELFDALTAISEFVRANRFDEDFEEDLALQSVDLWMSKVEKDLEKI